MYSGGTPCTTPGTPAGNSSLALAGKLLLFVEMENIEIVRIEIRTTGKRGRHGDEQNEKHQSTLAAHPAPSLVHDLFRRPVLSIHSHALSSYPRRRSTPPELPCARAFPAASRHRRRSCRCSGGQPQDRDCAKPTAPAIRARCDERCGSGSASGSSRRCISASGALSTSNIPARNAARSCNVEPSEASAARSSKALRHRPADPVRVRRRRASVTTPCSRPALPRRPYRTQLPLPRACRLRSNQQRLRIGRRRQRLFWLPTIHSHARRRSPATMSTASAMR